MMTEKILAAAEAQTAAAVAAMRGSKTRVVAGKAVDAYGKRVRLTGADFLASPKEFRH